MTDDGKCPRCNSPKPWLHPAVQWEGEVQPCEHDWHRAGVYDEHDWHGDAVHAPTLTYTVRRYKLMERVWAAWCLLFCDWGPVEGDPK